VAEQPPVDVLLAEAAVVVQDHRVPQAVEAVMQDLVLAQAPVVVVVVVLYF
jgi:hypothetical protein